MAFSQEQARSGELAARLQQLQGHETALLQEQARSSELADRLQQLQGHTLALAQAGQAHSGEHADQFQQLQEVEVACPKSRRAVASLPPGSATSWACGGLVPRTGP